MSCNLILQFSKVLTLQSFTLFAEYFLIVSLFYVLVSIVLIVYSIESLTIEKGLSECLFLIFGMVLYLLLNDELLNISFLSYNNLVINDYFSLIAKCLICCFSMIFFLVAANFL